ncbi:hypothetical protein C1J03_17090 [Sulfitobacter sp. SK012]|nr:hypothetical protein C1J03_17090 [Sulfitobacter sp. SK012]
MFIVVLGKIEDIVVVSVKEQIGKNCDYKVRARYWPTDESSFGSAARVISGTEWLMHDFCFVQGRNSLILDNTN